MKNSIERIYPQELKESEDYAQESLQLHLERYHFAGRNLVKGRVVDIACGVGYGSSLLVEKYGNSIESITAVDNDRETLNYAQLHYAHPKIIYRLSDALQFTSSLSFHNIISLETLEHLQDPEAFVRRMAAQLETGGHFIASVPVTPSMDANPFHLRDFTAASFRKMFIEAGFVELVSMRQLQPYNMMDTFLKKGIRFEGTRKNILHYYVNHPSKLLLRMRSLLVDGFSNKYMVAVFKKLC